VSAIYNEIDGYAAQWTRNLIAAGHVAPGVVDERSIADLRADDVAGPGQRHFFAGIGVWSYALRLAGVPDDADVWTGSCPCQGLSDAGRKLGFADPRHLWPVWFRLIDECRPPVIFGEQVASRLGLEWLDLVCSDLEGAGYSVGAADLGAASVGAPHIRQRLYFVAYADGEPGRLLLRERGPRPEGAEPRGRGEVGASRRDCACWDRDCSHRQHGVPIGLGQRFADGSVADAESVQRDRDWLARNRGRQPANGGSARRLAHAGRDQRGPRRASEANGTGTVESARRGDARGLGNSGRARGGRHAGGDGREEAASSGARSLDRPVGDEPVAPGADGFWSGCDWIPCSDGKSRPVEPGTFPLAHGVAGRVGRLRGYGNAINAQAAASFVTAALDAIQEAA
jgi:DNA (cytosine-5)-methyltransferase 1